MRRWVRIVNFLLLAGAATAFAAANGGELVRIDLGLLTLRGVSLPVVVFVSVLLGMSLVLLAGLPADLRTRRRLRRYRDALEEEPGGGRSRTAGEETEGREA